MKFFIIILFLLFSIIGKTQNSPDSIPVNKKILVETFRYKEGQKVKINFNQYVRFEGNVKYNDYNYKIGTQVISIENKNDFLILYNDRNNNIYSGYIIINNHEIFELNSKTNYYEFRYYWFKRLPTDTESS